MTQQLAGRDMQMAKIIANMDDVTTTTPLEEEDKPSSPIEAIQDEKLKREQIKTEREILLLEKAKENAKSEATKKAIQAEIEQAKIRKEELAKAKEQQTQTFKTAKDVHGIGHAIYSDVKTNVDGTVNKVGNTVNDTKHQLEGISVPGSIWLPITVLLVFFFLLLPVNGMTRAQWLFQTLVGNAQIGGATTNPQPDNSSATGGGAVGGYGGGSTNGKIRTFTR